MDYTFLEQRETELLDYLKTQSSVPLLSHQLKSPMREETLASVAVAFGLISKATLFTQEMGIGKTFVAMGLIENILRANPSKKILFCGTNDKLNEYVQLFQENLSPNFPVTWTTAGEKEVNSAFRSLKDVNVLIATHSIWDSGHHFHKKFIEKLDEFQCIIVDEGGMLFKNSDNYAYRMMEQFVPNLKYRYILNATPIERDLGLLINQCRVLGVPIPSRGQLFSMYGNINEDDYGWVFNNLTDLKDKLKYHVFNVSRADIESVGKINYILHPYLLSVTRLQEELINEDGAKNTRYPFSKPDLFTPKLYPSLNKLMQICEEGKNQNDKMLIYIRNVEPKVRIKQLLEEKGLTVGIYDGTHTNTHAKKRRVEQAFNDGHFDVLLTNKIYGLSLKIVNHVIMYDLPPNFYQYIYRAIRDLKSKNLKVSAIVYDYPNDYSTILQEVNSEDYQNQFSDRKFTLVAELQKMLNYKAQNNQYD